MLTGVSVKAAMFTPPLVGVTLIPVEVADGVSTEADVCVSSFDSVLATVVVPL